MNTRSAIENTVNPNALSVAFNQDASCFSVGLESGFSVFASHSCQVQVSRDFGAGVGIVQMVGRSNFIGMAGGGGQPKFPLNNVVVWDDAKQKIVSIIPTPTPPLGVRTSKTHIVVVLENSVHVYKLQTPIKLWQTFQTTDNYFGLCCLDLNTLAFPGRTPGQVQLVDLSSGNVSIIPAHGSFLRALVLSQNGEIIATASETGTLIKVFATHNCARIAEFRRGIDKAEIFSLAISPSGLLLAVTSDKSTLHIFDIPNLNKPPVVSRRKSASKKKVSKYQRASQVERLDTEPRYSRNVTQNNVAESIISSDHMQVDLETSKKWGALGRIPMLPRVFSDNYSFATAQFEIPKQANYSSFWNRSQRPTTPKGVIGWVSDEVIVVISAGIDPKWERFIIATNVDDRRFCVRNGWKNFLVNK